LGLKTLKIVTILAPGLFIGIVEVLRHTIFEESHPMIVGNVLVILAATIGAYFVSNFVFGKIDGMQRERDRRNLELEALNTVALSVNESLNLDVVLHRSLDNVLKILNAEAGEIFLLDEKSNEMVQKLHIGVFADAFAEKTRFKMGEGFVGDVARTGEPLLIRDMSIDRRLLRARVREKGFQSVAGVPLKIDRRVIGVICVFALRPHVFSLEDMRLLRDMGNQIAVAIENARLHEKVETMGALEERERIAREMHDGLAQVLSYTLTKSQAARCFMSSGQQSKAGVELTELENSVQEVYADVREAILGLRITAAPGKDFISVLRKYVLRFSQMSGVKAELETGDAKVNPLSPGAEFQIIRIVQEALTNVRKHAGARNAWVKIRRSNEHVEITVRDNGQGFDDLRAKQGDLTKFGIQTMRERIESIKGTLDISSRPGQGTTVTLSVPCSS